ncbi:MAG: hypothetical protein ACJASJ_001593 [Candidatus Azotimanducaceae bacterium]|jgi:hypothetical protein|tara:strand:- start:538 stop:810 length:273 start_codon:yes stop_codon:yes gene_type:complete
MKFKVMSLASSLILATFSLTGLADDETVSYAAKVNDDGKYCARIEVRDYSGVRSKLKCRTLAQWEARGYTIQVPAPQSALDQEAGSSAAE